MSRLAVMCIVSIVLFAGCDNRGIQERPANMSDESWGRVLNGTPATDWEIELFYGEPMDLTPVKRGL